MSDPVKCMFDTNVFNRIVDDVIPVQSLVDRVVASTTHIQRDEINNTKDTKRRAELMEVFCDVIAGSTPTDSFVLDTSRSDEAEVGGDRIVPTDSAIWGVSTWGQAKWGAEDDLYSRLKTELDSLKKKPNNTQDALIGEASIKGGYVLVTDDKNFAEVTKKYGGNCLLVAELLDKCAK